MFQVFAYISGKIFSHNVLDHLWLHSYYSHYLQAILEAFGIGCTNTTIGGNSGPECRHILRIIVEVHVQESRYHICIIHHSQQKGSQAYTIRGKFFGSHIHAGQVNFLYQRAG
ncbi:hypothetical protein D3C72_508640 [compost metagenome]